MKRFGSPGPDGVSTAFYQKFWGEVGISLTMMVNLALSTGKAPDQLLLAFITLIPKKERPENARDFRPITLLNVAYKIVSKVHVNRMRPNMQRIIGPTQNSFLPGRSTMDNIILAQEVVHYMNGKKGKKGLMFLKLDLHKTYDSVSWVFLKRVMEAFGFPKRLFDLILSGLKNCDISSLWNGEKLPFFKPKRGLRQGDLLTPYLINLVMEWLSMDIHNEVSREIWRSIAINRGGMGISNLFFANDLMLFSEATEDQAGVIMECMARFSAISGLDINLGKSQIFCSPNTPNTMKRRIGEVTKIPVTNHLGKYLGVLVLQKRVSKNDFAYILDNMKKKHATWQVGLFSLVGCRVLVHFALASVPVYTMQTLALPSGVCKAIDKTCRDFLLGDTDDKKRVHLVK